MRAHSLRLRHTTHILNETSSCSWVFRGSPCLSARKCLQMTRSSCPFLRSDRKQEGRVVTNPERCALPRRSRLPLDFPRGYSVGRFTLDEVPFARRRSGAAKPGPTETYSLSAHQAALRTERTSKQEPCSSCLHNPPPADICDSSIAPVMKHSAPSRSSPSWSSSTFACAPPA